MLARTGLRVGELCSLTADAVVLVKGRHWLRVPVGKLHNDRYIPLHPGTVNLRHPARSSADTADPCNGRSCSRRVDLGQGGQRRR
jgi:integrase